MITRQTVAGKIAAYLQHNITLEQLVDWAENAVMEGEFAPEEMQTLRKVVPVWASPMCAPLVWPGKTASSYCKNLGTQLEWISLQRELPSKYGRSKH